MNRVSYLTPHQMRRLDAACHPIWVAYSTPYLVGSVNERPDYRDVDVRCLLDPDQYDRMFDQPEGDGASHNDPRWQLLCMALSGELSRATGLNIDFQFQRTPEANEASQGKPRNPLGLRWERSEHHHA
jgi:hypothetical protein